MKKLNLEVINNIVYIEGEPAFLMLSDGEIDPISPNGMTMYSNNKACVDTWIKNGFSGSCDDYYQPKV